MNYLCWVSSSLGGDCFFIYLLQFRFILCDLAPCLDIYGAVCRCLPVQNYPVQLVGDIMLI